MSKDKKHIRLIIFAILIALIGLISLQVYLLIASYNEKEQAFDRNVIHALNTVSQQIEKQESASKIFNVAMQIPPPLQNGTVKKFKRFVPKDSANKKNTSGSFSWIVSDTIRETKGTQMRVEVFHSSGIDTMTTVMVRGKPGKKNGQQTIGYSYSTDENQIRISTTMSDSALVLLKDTTKKRRGEIVTQVVDKLFLVETLPIEERLNLKTLDTLIKNSLSNVGISMNYSFRVSVGNHDSVKITNDTTEKKKSLGIPYTARLFPNDIISPRYELSLFLPEKSSFIFNEITLVLILSLIFISLIIVSFIYTIRVIVLQKRFAVSIVDFINNMTHEFKTPISTIALASEAIAKPDVLKSKTKIVKYNSLITDENNRMKNQVDKILQLAVLEEGEFELKRAEIDLQSIIQQAVKNVSLQVEQKNGKIICEYHANNVFVNGDSVHLANIIHNVMENAIKYSPAIPTISIRTENIDPFIKICIGDSGIGISKEDLERVFEKYYRVSTGNTHDVKGFGLGLSYVKLIVEAHQGTVSIHSKIGEGTTVEIKLPNAKI